MQLDIRVTLGNKAVHIGAEQLDLLFGVVAFSRHQTYLVEVTAVERQQYHRFAPV